MTAVPIRRKRDVEWLWGLLLPLAVLVVAGTVWQVLALRSDSLIIPTFLETLSGVYAIFLRGEIWDALVRSNQAFVIGYAISVVAGTAIGLILARSSKLDSLVDPYINMWIAMPTAPLIPLIIMALGIGLSSRVLVVVIFALIYIIINTRAGVRNVDHALIEMARSFGASETDVWRKILLPGATPAILAGLRLGMARAIDGMIVAELLLVAVGIGNLLLRYRSMFEGGLMFATVVVVALQAAILISLMRALEKRLTPWV